MFIVLYKNDVLIDSQSNMKSDITWGGCNIKTDITWGGCNIRFDITWAIYKDVILI